MPRSARQMALSKQREADCLTLRVEGHTYDEIAEALGFASRSGAQKAFQRAVERIGAEEAREALVLEYERYNAMLAALWPDVDLGRPRAIRQALAVMERIDRLFGLDDPDCDCRKPTAHGGAMARGLPPGAVVIDVDPAKHSEVAEALLQIGASDATDDE